MQTSSEWYSMARTDPTPQIFNWKNLCPTETRFPKAGMTNILWSCPAAFSKDQEKEKNLEEERSVPQSAFLGPTLWDKTLSYDGDTFQLEYMDLEEFLSENGIPSSPSHHQREQHQAHHVPPRQPPIMTPVPSAPARSVMDLGSHASTSVVSPNCLHSSPARAGKSLRLSVLSVWQF